MKKNVIIAALIIAASSPSAWAAGPYVGASTGVSFFHDSDVKLANVGAFRSPDEFTFSYNTGYGFNVVGGYNFDVVRVEGEFGYKRADMDEVSALGFSDDMPDSDARIMSFMANCYYDIKNSSPVTPFIGAGIGTLNERFKLAGEAESDTVMGYQFTGGASYSVNRNVNLDISYRYQASAYDFSRQDVDIEYASSNVLFGMRYSS